MGVFGEIYEGDTRVLRNTSLLTSTLVTSVAAPAPTFLPSVYSTASLTSVPSQESTPLVGVPSVGSQGSVDPLLLVTAPGSGFTLHHPYDRKCVANLTIPASRGVPCGAIAHPAEGFYCILGSPLQLVLWREDTPSLAKAVTADLKDMKEDEIACMHTVPDMPGVLIVRKDGGVVHASTGSNGASTRVLVGGQGRGKWVWSQVVIDKAQGVQRLLAVFHNKSTYTVTSHILHNSDIRSVSGSPQSVTLSSTSHTQLSFSDGEPVIASVDFQWPDQLVFLTPRGEVYESDVGRGGATLQVSNDDSPSLVAQRICHLAAFADHHKASEPTLSVVSIDRQHVVLAGKELGSARTRLLSWDTRYNVLQGETHLPEGCGRVQGLVKVSRDLIAVTTTESVYFVPLDIPPSTLAHALGSLSASASVAMTTAPAASLLNTQTHAHDLTVPVVAEISFADVIGAIDSILTGPAHATPTTPATQSKKKKGKEEGMEGVEGASGEWEALVARADGARKLLADLADKTKFSSAAAFEAQCAAVLALFPRPALLPQLVADQMVSLILDETRFLAKDALVEILNRDIISPRTHPRLVRRLSENSACRELLLHALVHVQDIPEEDLAWLIGYYLDSKELSAGDASAGERPVDTLLRLVFSRAVSEAPLVAALKTLSLDNALSVLVSLQEWLVHLTTGSKRQLSRAYAIKVIPSLPQVIEWLSCVLDAKFSTLIVTQSSHPTLVAVAKSLHTHAMLCEQAKPLHGILTHLMAFKRIPKPATATRTPYSLEILHI